MITNKFNDLEFELLRKKYGKGRVADSEGRQQALKGKSDVYISSEATISMNAQELYERGIELEAEVLSLDALVETERSRINYLEQELIKAKQIIGEYKMRFDNVEEGL